MRPHGANKNEKAQLETWEGVAKAGHRLAGALTVAHAVWYFAGTSQGGRPEERALTRSLRVLTPAR